IDHPDEGYAWPRDTLHVLDGRRRRFFFERPSVDRVPHGVCVRLPAPLVIGQLFSCSKDYAHLAQGLPLHGLALLRMRCGECRDFVRDVIDSQGLTHLSDGALVQRIVEPKDALLRAVATGPQANPPLLQVELESEEPRNPVTEMEHG